MKKVSRGEERSFFLGDLPSYLVPEQNLPCWASEEQMWPGVMDTGREEAKEQKLKKGLGQISI